MLDTDVMFGKKTHSQQPLLDFNVPVKGQRLPVWVASPPKQAASLGYAQHKCRLRYYGMPWGLWLTNQVESVKKTGL